MKPSEERLEALTRLHEKTAEVREAVVRCRAQLQDLVATEQARGLTEDEATRVRALRWQGEQLMHELHVLRERFQELRHSQD
jgi:hypothetical protein